MVLEDFSAMFVYDFVNFFRYNRSLKIQRLRWQLGAVLLADIQEKLNFSEREFFKSYSDLLGSYMTSIDLDLTVVCTHLNQEYIFLLLVLVLYITSYMTIIIKEYKQKESTLVYHQVVHTIIGMDTLSIRSLTFLL